MKNKRIILIMTALIFISANMAGCQKTTEVNETKYFKLDIDGEKEYFDEESNEVKEVNSFMDIFMNKAINVDYTKSDEEIVEVLYLYTDEIIASDKEYGYHEQFIQGQKVREQIRDLVEYEIIEVDFYKMFGEDYANVTCSDISITSNVTEEYRESANLKLNQKYKTNRKFRLHKQSDGWRIQDVIYVEDRVEVNN